LEGRQRVLDDIQKIPVRRGQERMSVLEQNITYVFANNGKEIGKEIYFGNNLF
jgi:hypothetical protein